MKKSYRCGKKKFIIQSDDSEDDITNNESSVNNIFTTSDEFKKNTINKKTTRLNTFESSSDDENNDKKSTTTDPAQTINTTIAESDNSEHKSPNNDSSIKNTFTKRDKVRKNLVKMRKQVTRLKTFESSSDTDEDKEKKSVTTVTAKTIDKTIVESDDSEDKSPNNDSSVRSTFTTRDKERKNSVKKRKKVTRLKTVESSSDTDEDKEKKSVTTVTANTINTTLSESLSTIKKPENTHDENGQEKTKEKKSWYQNSEDLFEDESSGDESKCFQENKQSNMEEEDMDCTSSIKPKPLVSPKERASKKKALNEIQEIHKESQRMMRQSYVSIPYHRPRQRTLAEFRARRTTVPSVSLRTSSDKLITAWKAIEQREQEAETFYKSESSEDESESEELQQSADVTEEGKSDKGSSNSSDNNKPANLRDVSLVDAERNDTNKICEDVKSSAIRDLDSYIEDSIDKSALNSEAKENHDESSVTNIVAGETRNKESFESEERDEVDTDVNRKEQSSGILEEDKSDYKNSETKQYAGHEIHLVEDRDNNCLTGNKTGSTEVEMTKCGDDNSLVCDKNNSVNTEEFSLRMSESQPELETFSQHKNSVEETYTSKHKDSSEIEILENTEGTQTGMEISNSKLETGCSKINSDYTLNKNTITSEKKIIRNSDDIDICPISQQKDCLEEKLHETLNGSNKIDSSERKLGKKYNLNLINPLSNAPKMSAFDCEEIVLDEVVPKPGVNNLIERFLTHLSYKKKPLKKKVPLELSVVSAETDSAGHVSAINKDVVQVMVGDEEEEEDPALAKPGAKLARLRAQLQAEMERQRQQEWEKKQKDQKLYEEEIYEGEKDICDAEEEDEPEQDTVKESEADTSEEEDPESDEEECDEEEESGKQKNKSAFIDDEAEESDDDECMDKDEEDSSNSFIKRPSKKKIILKRTKTEDMFLSQEGIKSSTAEEEEWPSFQKPCQVDKIEEEEESDSPICPSPAFRLTALEGKDITRTNWSEPSTPCKDFVSPKIFTPVRSGPFSSIVEKSPSVSSQDLENLCSGRFVTQPVQDVEENNSQDFHLFLADDSQISQDQENTLDSPIVKTKSADGKDHMRSLLIDDNDDISKSIVTKKAKKLNFSDDEDEQDDDNLQQLKDDSGGSDVEEETAADDPDTAPDEIEYDSEENEVVKTAGDFLDKEAELSESEWGSEDEDEFGLDILDTEEADKEKIDQRRLQQQLGQIHMKQLLVEDKEQVRRLQELLLDDGELHSDNRRRKLFRWSNNITFGDDNKPSMDSDEDKAEEDEDEESWRKERHAREQFLSEYSKKAGNLELAEDECFDSKLFQLGQKTLQRLKKSNQTLPAVKTSVTVPSPDPKRPFCAMMNMKRGSFLSRGQQVLSRLAQMVSTSDGPINQPKNSRNFVFASISPTKAQGEEEVKPLQTNKRKMPVLPLPVAKKPCIQKPKIANKKSLFEALAKVQS